MSGIDQQVHEDLIHIAQTANHQGQVSKLGFHVGDILQFIARHRQRIQKSFVQIVNAAHAIRQKLKGTGKGQIVVRTRTCGPFAEIAVSDTGTGISPEVRPRIFEPFFTTKEVGAGTGQGLALAHSVVVKKHQGKIWCETEVGAGTTFFVHLPIGSARAPEENRC